MSEYGSRNRNGSRKSNTSRTDETDKRVNRLPLRTERKAVFIDKEAIKVANFLRGSEKNSKQATNDKVREQLNKLLFYLADEGNWNLSKYEDIEPLLDDDKKGVEADVYLWNNHGEHKVIKVTKWWVRQRTPLEFVENKILSHNELFPQTAYKLAGIRYEGGELLFFLEQTYVRCLEDEYATQTEIDEDMKKRGFVKTGNGAYSSTDYVISDLNSKNVLKGIDNELYYIDPIIYQK
jgi:hypothetical protein